MSAATLALQESYDRVADEYVKRIYGELEGKPFDREQLKLFLAQVGELGPICDLGCGPGQVARFLKDNGCNDVFGIDLSPQMVVQARKLSPDIEFHQGNMMKLDISSVSLGGITAFYSIIHIPRDQIVTCLIELKRVLRAGGLILLTFHIGDETVHLDEWWNQKVSLDFNLLRTKNIKSHLCEAGFQVEQTLERDPYSPDVEHQSRRAYILAKKVS